MKKIKEKQEVITPHGVAVVTRVEEVYGSHDDCISVKFPDGRKSQYTSASLSEVLSK